MKILGNNDILQKPKAGQAMVTPPNRPSVMGVMFHGKAGGGGSGDNVKGLSSKSGNIACLNDGAEIEIKDKNGDYVTLSGTGGINTFVSNDSTENFGNNHTSNIASTCTFNVGKKQV